jgi:hypothetical protein
MVIKIPKIPDYINQNLGLIGVGAAGAALGAGIGIGASKLIGGASKRKKKRTYKRKTKKRRLTPLMKRRRKIIKRKGRQTPYTARGGRDRSTRRIRYTKNGQPYVLMKSGKAKFIKKKSAKRSHKRKGGRY